jgi:hypothetical protein
MSEDTWTISISTARAEYGVKIACFVLHFCVSIIVMGFLFGCNTVEFNQWMYKNEVFDYGSFRASPLNASFTCNSQMSCFRIGVPWGNQFKMDGFYWNPYSILFAVEWITTSMSLAYLKKDMHVIQHFVSTVDNISVATTNAVLYYLAIAWNIIGFLIYGIFFLRYQQNNMLEALFVTFSFGLSTAILIFYDLFIQPWIKREFGSLQTKTASVQQAKCQGKMWNIPHVFLKVIATKTEETSPLISATIDIEDNVCLRSHVIFRYLEYLCTAPLLYICVLCVMVVGPPFWAFMVGYTCMFACCFFGVPLHIMHIQEKIISSITRESNDLVVLPAHDITNITPDINSIPPPPPRNNVVVLPDNSIVAYDPNLYGVGKKISNPRFPVINVPINRLGMNSTSESQSFYVHNYNNKIQASQQRSPLNILTSIFLMGKISSHWSAKFNFFQISVYALMMSMAIVIYLARDLLTTSILPTYVTYALWNLIIMYSIFGLVAFLYYYVFDNMWESMDTSFDALSLLAKVPIALALCGGYLNMPGNTCNPRV